ncbi:hypothetical protein W97_00206 [Coniosporium apollinis CBS 100218]|uniref:Ribosome biogenesis protein NOP53 n=1 Tax=Coniosporium apollinis (strain CBS 100218) TaxID=1168221 RepID=R7YH73_CONA1|nr:uncharacterized protein W97_00206 [Coniosporium apollinis CBS 100218]EON60996.1 hypothetical protein W97_00206 [Coniosporium apollinis CBS 100218]
MSTAIEAPRQPKQPSRKGKKAWRKNVDITEIQQGLETVQDEVIKGGVIAEKPSTSLFIHDTAGSATIQKSVLKTHKPLKADEILAARSAIPAVDSRKRPASRTTDGIVPSSKKLKSGGVSHQELERLKRVAYGGAAASSDVVQASESASHDPWAVEERVPDARFSFLEAKKAIREPPTLKHAPVSLAASGKPVPAVRKPEAGRSYNPLFEDYAALISREGEKEVEAEKKRLAEAREEAERLERAVAAEEREHESAWESEWESEWEGFQSEAEEAEKLKMKRPERKTQAERNKIKRRKEAERLAVHEAGMKAKEQQQRRIRELAKEVEAKERARKQTQALVVAGDEVSSDEEEVLRRRQFGKVPVPQAPLEVVLEDELQDSLRLLKPEGNLLKDRYRSMLLRGRVETRRRITQAKKRKTTVTEKWSYKDWKLPTR